MNNNHDNGKGFSNGFFLGLIVGGLLVFLFATKKGRRLLKILTEEGLEGVAEVEEFLEDSAEGKTDVQKPKKKAEVKKTEHKETVEETKSSEEDVMEEVPVEHILEASHQIQKSVEERHAPVRRFFRGISSRKN